LLVALGNLDLVVLDRLTTRALARFVYEVNAVRIMVCNRDATIGCDGHDVGAGEGRSRAYAERHVTATTTTADLG